MSTNAPHGDRPVETPDDVENLDWPEYRYLAPWLRTALRGLSSDACARLREEIGSHFNDALEDGIRRGLSEEAAGRRAVESLGSPWSARWRFHRTYLTAIEKLQLDRIRHLDRWTFVVLGLICAFDATRLFTEPRLSWPNWDMRAALLGLEVIGLLAIGVMSLLARRGHLRAAVVVGALAFPTFYLSWVSQHLRDPLERGYGHLVVSAVLVVFFLVMYLSLFLKLPSDTERA